MRAVNARKSFIVFEEYKAQLSNCQQARKMSVDKSPKNRRETFKGLLE